MLLLAASLSSLSSCCAPWVAGSPFLLLHSPVPSTLLLGTVPCSVHLQLWFQWESVHSSCTIVIYEAVLTNTSQAPDGDMPRSSPTPILMLKCVFGTHLSFRLCLVLITVLFPASPFPLKMVSAFSACPAPALRLNRPSIHFVPNWQAAHFPGT